MGFVPLMDASTNRHLLEHRCALRKLTTIVHFGVCAAFDSIDKSALWDWLSSGDIPETFAVVLK